MHSIFINFIVMAILIVNNYSKERVQESRKVDCGVPKEVNFSKENYKQLDTIPQKDVNLRAVKIISFNRRTKSNSKTLNLEVKQCRNWFLNKKNILEIFSLSKLISGTEWDLSYAVYPCYYSGTVEINGVLGSYEINAGSYIILALQGQTLYFGCTSQKIKKYFLCPPNLE